MEKTIITGLGQRKMSEDDFEDLSEEFEKALEEIKELKSRCDARGIEYQDETDAEFEDIDFTINFPNGRETRRRWFVTYEDLKAFNSIEFEKFTIIGPYSAIYCQDQKKIEAIITAPNYPKFSITRLRRFLLPTEKKVHTLESNVDDSKYKISIAVSSKEIKAITDQPDPLNLSLKIFSEEFTNTEKALKALITLSNSLFFDMEVQNKVFLSLARHSSKRKRDALSREPQAIEHPKNIYDEASMELYWYARSAINMPLLQFLAYYQAIEYHYSTFSNLELTKKLRAIIKNPAFRVGNDSDISKVISAIRAKGAHLGAEREQLKATLKECLDEDDILKFLNLNTERINFFNSKAKGITSKTINFQNRGIDLSVQVAERIYDIRCKIVHTKGDDSDGEIELLLPFSKEAEKLDQDIELVRFVAQKIIIQTSSTLLS